MGGSGGRPVTPASAPGTLPGWGHVLVSVTDARSPSASLWGQHCWVTPPGAAPPPCELAGHPYGGASCVPAVCEAHTRAHRDTRKHTCPTHVHMPTHYGQAPLVDSRGRRDTPRCVWDVPVGTGSVLRDAPVAGSPRLVCGSDLQRGSEALEDTRGRARGLEEASWSGWDQRSSSGRERGHACALRDAAWAWCRAGRWPVAGGAVARDRGPQATVLALGP